MLGIKCRVSDVGSGKEYQVEHNRCLIPGMGRLQVQRLPDVCGGDVGHHDQGTEVDPLTQLLLPSGPGVVVSLGPGIRCQVKHQKPGQKSGAKTYFELGQDLRSGK